MTEPWSPPSGLPDVYIAMGQTAENVAELEKVSRAEMDEFALLSQTRAVESQSNGFFEREIIPVTTPDGTVVTKDDGPRPEHHPRGARPAEAGVPGGRHGDRRQRLPAERRRRGGDRHERRPKAAELGITPLARIVASGVSALDPEIMGLGPVDACRQTLRAGRR